MKSTFVCNLGPIYRNFSKAWTVRRFDHHLYRPTASEVLKRLWGPSPCHPPMAAMRLGAQEGDFLLNIMRQGLTMAGGHGRAKTAWMLNGQLVGMKGYSRFVICKLLLQIFTYMPTIWINIAENAQWVYIWHGCLTSFPPAKDQNPLESWWFACLISHFLPGSARRLDSQSPSSWSTAVMGKKEIAWCKVGPHSVLSWFMSKLYSYRIYA